MILLALELAYFKIANKFNIIDKPNERSSHSTIVLRGGGIIFLLSLWIWSAFFGFQYLWALLAVSLIAGVSFIDDIRSLPDSVRLVAQFIAMAMMFYQLDILHWDMWWIVFLALIVCVGASNVINFMDGVNGITGVYAMVSLIPLAILNSNANLGSNLLGGFIDQSLVYVVILADLVFCLFNFRPKGKAKCFAGDVGSIGVAYILLFMIGSLILTPSNFPGPSFSNDSFRLEPISVNFGYFLISIRHPWSSVRCQWKVFRLWRAIMSMYFLMKSVEKKWRPTSRCIPR